MFQNLAEVIAHYSRGAAAVPHPLVPGESEWLKGRGRELEARVEALTAQQQARIAHQRSLDAKHQADRAWWEQEVEGRKGDAVTLRVKGEIEQQQQEVDALKAKVEETLTELRTHPKGSEERFQSDQVLRRIHQDLREAKRTVAETRRWLAEHQELHQPARETTQLPDVGAELALAKVLLENHKAFAALAGTEGPATQVAAELRSTLKALNEHLAAYTAQAEALEAALGRSSETLVEQLVKQEVTEEGALTVIARSLGMYVD